MVSVGAIVGPLRSTSVSSVLVTSLSKLLPLTYPVVEFPRERDTNLTTCQVGR